jgi:hypothetical protein
MKKGGKRRIVPWQYIFLMVVVNKQYKEGICHLCEIETLSRS